MELGIWSDQAGGFIDAQFYSEAEARTALAELDNESREDAEILEVCPEHPEYAARFCDECDAEDDDEEA